MSELTSGRGATYLSGLPVFLRVLLQGSVGFRPDLGLVRRVLGQVLDERLDVSDVLVGDVGMFLVKGIEVAGCDRRDCTDAHAVDGRLHLRRARATSYRWVSLH